MKPLNGVSICNDIESPVPSPDVDEYTPCLVSEENELIFHVDQPKQEHPLGATVWHPGTRAATPGPNQPGRPDPPQPHPQPRVPPPPEPVDGEVANYVNNANGRENAVPRFIRGSFMAIIYG